MSHLIILPTALQVTKAKRVSVNLNWYRNAHHHELNKAKVLFKELVTEQILALPRFEKVAITYTVFPKTRQLQDIGNVCSIADKFFCDALVELGKLEDDNYKFVLGTQQLFGAIDPSNPRVEARIHPHR